MQVNWNNKYYTRDLNCCAVIKILVASGQKTEWKNGESKKMYSHEHDKHLWWGNYTLTRALPSSKGHFWMENEEIRLSYRTIAVDAFTSGSRCCSGIRIQFTVGI